MDTNTSFERATFDGRIAQHKRLDILWLEFHKAYMTKNFFDCIGALDLIIIESGAYMDKELEQKYINTIDSLSVRINMTKTGKVNPNTVNSAGLSKELRNLARSIKDSSKRLYLPIEELDLSDDALFERIKRESD